MQETIETTLCMFRCMDLLSLHVLTSRLSGCHIGWLSRSAHGVWLDNPVLLLLCQRGWSFSLAPLCLPVCWYICLLVLEDLMSGGGRVRFFFSVTRDLLFFFIEWFTCFAWFEWCSRQLHTTMVEWHGYTDCFVCMLVGWFLIKNKTAFAFIESKEKKVFIVKSSWLKTFTTFPKMVNCDVFWDLARVWQHSAWLKLRYFVVF